MKKIRDEREKRNRSQVVVVNVEVAINSPMWRSWCRKMKMVEKCTGFLYKRDAFKSFYNAEDCPTLVVRCDCCVSPRERDKKERASENS